MLRRHWTQRSKGLGARVALGLAVTFFALPARAGDVAVAEALYREGLRLMEAEDYAAACPKLAESQRQDPATGTLLALSMCQERIGKTASAWANYTLVATEAKNAGRADRESVARERLAALEPRLSKLTIEVSPEASPDLSIRRDDVEIGRGAWGVAVPVDPGEHVIVASAPGKAPWRTTVTLGGQADLLTVRVPVLEDAGETETPAEGAPAGVPASGDDGTETSSPLPIIGLGVGGAGIVALGIGSYFGLRAKSLDDESRDSGLCDENLCNAEGGEKRNDALAAADAATVAFIAGGVLVATGATLYIVGSAEDEEAASIAARPDVGVGAAGVSVVGSF